MINRNGIPSCLQNESKEMEVDCSSDLFTVVPDSNIWIGKLFINFALAKLLRTATEEKVRERERGRVRKVH